MNLKELLGEDLHKQVMDKIGDNKIAIVSDGNWIPKEKFDSKNEEVKNLKEEIKERDNQLSDLKEKAKDNDDLKQQIQELQDSNEEKQKEFEKKLEAQAKDSAIELALRDAKAKNPKIAKSALDLESISYKDGKLIGIDEQLRSDLKEKAKDNDDLKQQIQELQDSNEEKQKEFEKKLEAQAKDSAIELALRDAKAKNPKIAKSALDLESISYKDGKLIGIDEQL